MSTRDDTIAIAVGEESIAGTIVTLGTVVPGVLFLHGWGGSQNQYLARAREIAALGCVSLTVDFRGHAASEHQRETVSREDNLRDAMAAYDALIARRPVDASRIAVVGSSYGGYLAAILTTLRPVKWLGLRAPALYKDADWNLPKQQLNKDPDLHAYRRRQLPPQDNRALRACAEFKGDVLLVESEHDDLVPHPAIENYVEACKHAHSLTYRVLQGADHGLSTEPSQRAYTELLTSWMREMVFGVRETGVSAQGSAPAKPARHKEPAKED